MKKKCEKMEFNNKVNIFISSAMNDEEGFTWKEIREKIKEQLDKCPLLNTFIIEEHGSTIPSTQLFKCYVGRADIVILLLKGTVRPGTYQEFNVVMNKHKKLIPYFIKTDHTDLSVLEIKKYIQESDYCLYYDYDPSSGQKLEEIIFKHIMENLVDECRIDKLSINDDNEETQEYMLGSVSKYDSSIPKLILNNFDSCYGKSLEILGIKRHNIKKQETSKLHEIGFSMLKWLMEGYSFPKNEEIITLINTMKESFDNTQWLTQRWEACKCMANDDIKNALMYEKNALKIAEESNLPSWIITDILIDCRNMTNMSKQFSETEFQDRLLKLEELIYFPGLDRFCSNLFNDVIDEEQYEIVKAVGEYRFGNSFNSIIKEYENCLFISMLYGSYTHIVLAREALAKVLYQCGVIYNSENLIFWSVKLYILAGDWKKLEKIINHDLEAIENELIINADCLLELAMNRANINIILVIIKKFIVYFSDASIKKAERYLVDLSQKVEWSNTDLFIKTINYANGIICSENIVIMFTNLLKRKVIPTYSFFTATLINLDISGVNKDILNDLCKTLKENAEVIANNNGKPQYIAAMINQRSDIFCSLKDVPNNGLVNDELILFDINTESDYNAEKWQEVLRCQIKDVENQMNVNSCKGFYSDFSTHPFMTIKDFIESSHCKFTDIKKIIDNELVPLCIQILKNNIAIPLTDECIACLISMVTKCKQSKLSISGELINLLKSKEDTENETRYTVSPFNVDCANNIKYRLLMLKMLCNIDVRDEMYSNYLNFTNKNEEDRIAISECLKEYFEINRDGVFDPILISLAFLLCNDVSQEVRMNACYCVYFLTTNKDYSNFSYIKLREFSTDSHPQVRNTLLKIYTEYEELTENEKYKDIISNLIKDAHYVIRHKAKRLLS